MTSVILWCLLHGNSEPFSVDIEPKISVDKLKKAIKAEAANDLSDIDAHRLKLWMLNTPVPVDDANTFHEQWQDPTKLAKLAVQLKPAQKLSRLSLINALDDHITVIVEYPRGHRNVSPPIDFYAKRSDTVKALYEKLSRYHYIHVRGTPASGKTTLVFLLQDYIRRHEPTTVVTSIAAWPEVKGHGGWFAYLSKMNVSLGGNGVFIIDEAQTSYNDEAFWLHIVKPIDGNTPYRVITFASYGSPLVDRAFPLTTTPALIPDVQRVTLHHINHQDGTPPVGLYLTKPEYQECLAVQKYPTPFDPFYLDKMFEWTLGHVGAVVGWFRFVTAHDSYRDLRNIGGSYTWNLFQREVSSRAVFDGLSAGTIFNRGLPRKKDLQITEVASVLRMVLYMGFMTDDTPLEEEEQGALQHCFQHGWLHTDRIGSVEDEHFVYFFASPLHRWFVQAQLGTYSTGASIKDDNLFDLVIGVIRLFSPKNLSISRNLNLPQAQQPPEAQFQQEFYRCFEVHAPGSLIWPEFGTADGRIDFFIPDKEWGIEVLRDGQALAEHSSRFSATGTYRGAVKTEEHIILDFRTTHPRLPHPSLEDLYHVVFDENYNTVSIIDNMLNGVPEGSFALLVNNPTAVRI